MPAPVATPVPSEPPTVLQDEEARLHRRWAVAEEMELWAVDHAAQLNAWAAEIKAEVMAEKVRLGLQ